MELNADSWLWPQAPQRVAPASLGLLVHDSPSCPVVRCTPASQPLPVLFHLPAALPSTNSLEPQPTDQASPPSCPTPARFLYIPHHSTIPRLAFVQCLSLQDISRTRARMLFLIYSGAQNRVTLMGGARSKVQNESVNEQRRSPSPSSLQASPGSRLALGPVGCWGWGFWFQKGGLSSKSGQS